MTAALDADDIAILATRESITEILRIPAGPPDRRARRGSSAGVSWRPMPRTRSERCTRESASARTAIDELAEQHPHDDGHGGAAGPARDARPDPRPVRPARASGRARRPGAVLPRARQRARPDRLGLARWLVDPANPLTARVAVNRDWQMLFGTGLVKTRRRLRRPGRAAEPSRAARLAGAEFVRSGWDVKACSG